MALSQAQQSQINIINGWAAIVRPLLPQFKNEEFNQFFAWGGTLEDFIAWLMQFASTNVRPPTFLLFNQANLVAQPATGEVLPQHLANGVVASMLTLKSNAINGIIGTSISRNATTGQFDPGPQKAIVPFVAPSFIAPPLSPEQIAALPADVIIGDSGQPVPVSGNPVGGSVPLPEVQPPGPPQVLDSALFTPVTLPAAGPAPPNPPPEGTAETFAAIAAKSAAGPVQKTENFTNGNMAILAQDEFKPASSTFLPTAGGPIPDPQFLFGISKGLGSLIGGAIGSIIPGVGTAIGAGLGGTLLGGGGGASTTGLPGTPGIAPTGLPIGSGLPSGAKDPSVTAALVKLLAELLPGGEISAVGGVVDALLGGAQSGLIKTPFLNPSPTGDFGGFTPGGQISIPLNGATATTGLPIAPVLQATQSICHRAPKGYVVVEITGSNGLPVKVAMWKPLARSMKLFKSRPKPPISASEMKSLRTAKRVKVKSKKIAMLSGFKCVNR